MLVPLNNDQVYKLTPGSFFVFSCLSYTGNCTPKTNVPLTCLDYLGQYYTKIIVSIGEASHRATTTSAATVIVTCTFEIHWLSALQNEMQHWPWLLLP